MDEYEICVQKNGPVWVIILGWTASFLENLTPYTKLYKSLGISTISSPCSFWQTMSPFSKSMNMRVSRRIVEKLVDFEGDLRLWSMHRGRRYWARTVFVHAFSNGGFQTYLSLNELITEEPHIYIEGLIVDSAPSFISPTISPFLLSVTGLPRKTKIFNMPLALGWAMVGYFWNPFRNYLKEAASAKKNPAKPELFLFSDGDRLIRAEKIAEFINERSKVGCEVTVVRFADSPHVQHYRYYKKRYRENVAKFILPRAKL